MTHKEKTIHLYGVKKCWGALPYDTALKVKNLYAEIELKKEETQSMETRDFSRITDIQNAIKFNELMIKE